MISGFKDDASKELSNKIAGLRFANRPNEDLSSNNPFSGFSLGGRESHLGPPTAPNKIEST